MTTSPATIVQSGRVTEAPTVPRSPAPTGGRGAVAMTGAIGDADASTGGGAAPPTPPPPTAATADAGPSSYADVAGACGAGATIGTGAGADGASDTTGTGLGDAAGAALAAGDVRGFGTNGLAGRSAVAGCVDC